MDYTKGEWKAFKSATGDWVVTTEDTVICREARHFNAQLIASAPDLYEALKQVAVLLANPLTTRKEATKTLRLIRASDEAWQLALKALAKAEGK